MKLLSLTLIFFALTTSLVAETKIVNASPGWVELEVESLTDLDVVWEAKSPLTLSYREYLQKESKKPVCVLFLPNAGEYVIVSDVIDWKAQKRWKDTWVIRVGNGPNPNPPSPDPVDPRPILPGFPGEVQREIRKTGITVELAQRLSANYRTVGEGCKPQRQPDGHVIAALYTSPQEAQQAIKGLNRNLPIAMKEFHTWLSNSLNAAVKREATTVEQQMDVLSRMFIETSQGIGGM